LRKHFCTVGIVLSMDIKEYTGIVFDSVCSSLGKKVIT